ncbi:phosphotransferase family protein [Caldovatus aquaticus]|uniref:Phosphotransferase family protein n=1 Tax=Caldovatus aquaticus TaxID=2865671 RepID=A0ABS7F4I3_9PROT|nr:phosphotransferase family protein [Caldovatus aquaticus]MBW8270428.1 phosphotransferase family protein [Caldovatus aquaticus]
MGEATKAGAAAAPEFDPARLDAFLREALPGLEGPMAIERVAGGQSNPTFFVTYANRRLVLRKQPPGELLPSAHAVDREFRVMRALAATPVPVPPALLFHEGREVVGTPFYVMERMDGRVFRTSDMKGAARAERRAMVMSFAETLAALHDVDWRAAGLEGFGRPGNYYARQVARWIRQWEAARFRDLPDLARLAAWLPAHMPADDGVTTIVHGDYRIGNVMFAPAAPRVAAVLDWELSTLGHPLADLAFACLAWRSRPDMYGGLLGLDLEALGMPTEQEFVAHYLASRRRGPVAPPGTFHIAFALFRFAVIFEGIAARARAGTAAAADAAEVGDLSMAFARIGVETIEAGAGAAA